ncbi:hypothetical protein [Moorena producens]|nr:hypothetical protein [Moorena producens]
MHNKTEDLLSLLAKAGACWEGLRVAPKLPTPYSLLPRSPGRKSLNHLIV